MSESRSEKTARKAISAWDGFAVGLLGAVIGIFVQNAPWGNGFIGAGQFFGCVVSSIVLYALLRRIAWRSQWLNRLTALAITLILFSAVGYTTARPPAKPTLEMMLGGPLPSGVQIESVRCHWFDGQIYAARFHADAAAFETIFRSRSYEDRFEGVTDVKSKWRSAFNLAAIGDWSWTKLPPLQSPRIYTWWSGPASVGGRSESASLMIDDATGNCWLVYSWTS